MATLVNGVYWDYWYYSENKMYAYIYGSILRNDNTVNYNISSAQTKLIQVTQYGSKGYSAPCGIKNANKTVVTTGSSWWPYDYMYPATFIKDITGFKSWSYNVADTATSMNYYIYEEDGDKSVSVSFPARPIVSMLDVKDKSVMMSVSLAGYGDTYGANRYLELALMDGSVTTYGGTKRSAKFNQSTYGEATLDDTSTGTLEISPNTLYKYGGYATADADRVSQTITGIVITKCSAPIEIKLLDTNAYEDGSTLKLEVTRAEDGGASERTLMLSYSIDGGETWKDYAAYSRFDETTAIGTIDKLPTNTNVKVKAAISNEGGISEALIGEFTTSDINSMIYFKSPSTGHTKRAKALYVKDDTSGKTKAVVKMYANKDGKTKLVYEKARPVELHWGALTYTENGEEITYYIKTQDDFNKLCNDDWVTVPIVFSDGTSVYKNTILGFEFGPNVPETIGQSFLSGCTVMTRKLTIPSGVTSIGSYFLYESRAFTGPLVLETSAHPQDNCSLATYVATNPMYATGVTLEGPYAQVWKDALPDRDVEGEYRRLKIAGPTVTVTGDLDDFSFDEETFKSIAEVGHKYRFYQYLQWSSWIYKDDEMVETSGTPGIFEKYGVELTVREIKESNLYVDYR